MGIECHIIPQKDHPSVARAPSSLSEEERERFADLIADPDGFHNLVMMCLKHSRIVDDPNQPYSVPVVVEMKQGHEREMEERNRSSEEASRDAAALVYSEVVEEWEKKFNIADWRSHMQSLVGDGHPRIDEEDFDALTTSRDWLFSRVWPGTLLELEGAFENFRRICADLQAVLSQHRHKVLADRGVIAVAKFYNDRRYWDAEGPDQARLGKLFDFYVFLVEDLTYELTRAANLICDLVRENLDARYRVDEGVVTIESGPYMPDFHTIVHRPHYADDSGATPYRGLQKFLTDRAKRDEHRDEGGPPEGVLLPGESPFGD